MPTYTCKSCSDTFASLGQLSKHMNAEHPVVMRKLRAKKKRERAAAIVEEQAPEYDAETALVINALALFEQSVVDDKLAPAAYGRVAHYLATRFGAG